MIDIQLLQTAVAGTRARTPKALIPLAVNKGKTLPLLELALEVQHNRKTTRSVGDVRAAWDRVRPPRWPIVLQKQLFSLYDIGRVLTYPHVERATRASHRGTITQAIRRKLAMAEECTSNAPALSEVATIQAAHLWGLFERQHITLWYDNYRRYISGVDPHNSDKSLHVTAIAVLHTIELPQYLGLPSLDVVAEEVSQVIAYVVRCFGLLLQRSTILDGPIPRTWVRAPLDLACAAVVSTRGLSVIGIEMWNSC